MASGLILDWQEIQNVSLNEIRILALADTSALIFLACSNFYNNRDLWLNGGAEIDDTTWDEISKAIAEAETQIMSSLVGVILPNVLADLTDTGMLACDGSVYNRVDYPLLYAAIDSSLIIDADTFAVPDLRDKFALSEGVDFSLGDTGGERDHVLTGTELAEHTHDNAPHAHAEIIAVATVGAAITGVPVPSAIPSAGTTSFESISINPAGESEPHNNMPPYLVVRWAIVAG